MDRNSLQSMLSRQKQAATALQLSEDIAIFVLVQALASKLDALREDNHELTNKVEARATQRAVDEALLKECRLQLAKVRLHAAFLNAHLRQLPIGIEIYRSSSR